LAYGGELTDGGFTYYVGGGVNLTDNLEIQGYNNINVAVTDKIKVELYS